MSNMNEEQERVLRQHRDQQRKNYKLGKISRKEMDNIRQRKKRFFGQQQREAYENSAQAKENRARKFREANDGKDHERDFNLKRIDRKVIASKADTHAGATFEADGNIELQGQNNFRRIKNPDIYYNKYRHKGVFVDLYNASGVKEDNDVKPRRKWNAEDIAKNTNKPLRADQFSAHKKNLTSHQLEVAKKGVVTRAFAANPKSGKASEATKKALANANKVAQDQAAKRARGQG